jgi:hypothetical protein
MNPGATAAVLSFWAAADRAAQQPLNQPPEGFVTLFDGKGRSLCSAKDYGDFEMLVDWKIDEGGDSGIYLRGSARACAVAAFAVFMSPLRTASKRGFRSCVNSIARLSLGE